jgi:chloride channel protein, CIC family
VPDVISWAYLRTLALAAALGPVVAIAVVLFESAVHGLMRAVWEDLPDAFGWSAPQAWYVVLIPGVAGLLVVLALRLPGHGGHGPLDPLGADPFPPLELLSVLIAGLATLGLGLVLGPEAPLLAIGATIGLVAARSAHPEPGHGQLLVLAGSFAAIAALFGGPIVAAFLLFEITALSGKIPPASLAPALVPGFLASGTAALLFTGVAGWQGLHHTTFSNSVLPDYPTVRAVDVAWCLLVAVAVAASIVALKRGAQDFNHRSAAWTPVPVLAGLAVGALAVVFREVANRPVELVLFSGQGSLAEIVGESSASVLALLVLAKGLAYALSLGAGFRGGPVFPALTLGIIAGTLAAILLPGLERTPAVIAGVAAAAAGIMRMPFFAAVVASLLAGSAGFDAMPIAVLAAVVGWLIATAAERWPAPAHE